jgi:hypothetical protein
VLLLVALLFLSVLVLFCFGLSAVLLLLVLVCFVCGCSSGWLWWLCCSVRFFAPGVFCSSWLFWFVVSPVRCTVLVLVAPVRFMLLLVRVLLFWWVLVVVGPAPLFLLLLVLSSWWWLVDLGCFSSSWFFFLTFSATPGWGGLCVVLPVLV